jgi:hypothetical protein
MTSHDTKTSERENEGTARRELLAAGFASAATALCGLFAAACSVDNEGTLRPVDGAVPPLLDASTPDIDAGAVDGSVTDSAPPVEAAVPLDAAREPDVDSGPLNALLATAYELATAYGACGVLIQGAPSTDAFASIAAVLRDTTVSFQAHQKAHAQELVTAIVNLGGKPITEQEVTSAFKAPETLRKNPTITNVIKYAAARERAAAIACNRAISKLEASYYRYLVSTIEGVQAQHFALWLSLLTGLVEGGSMFDPSTVSKVVPTAFVRAVEKQPGLDTVPPRYFG